MEFVFALPESASVAYGAHGVWLSRDDAYPPDDPFVLAHPEMFSATPSRARSTDGRTFTQEPLPAVAPAGDEDVSQFGAPRRGRRANV